MTSDDHAQYLTTPWLEGCVVENVTTMYYALTAEDLKTHQIQTKVLWSLSGDVGHSQACVYGTVQNRAHMLRTEPTVH